MLNPSAFNMALAKLLIHTTHLFMFSYSIELSRLTSWSENAHKILGVSDDDIIHNKNILFRNIHHQDLLKVMGAFNKAIKEKGVVQVTYRWKGTKNEPEKTLHLRAGVNEVDNEYLLEGFIIDVTNLDVPKKVITKEITPTSIEDAEEIEQRTIKTILAAIPEKVIVLNTSLIITCVSSPSNLDDFNFGDKNFSHDLLQNGELFLKCFNDENQKHLFNINLERILKGENDTAYIRIAYNERNYAVNFSALKDNISVNGIIILVSDISDTLKIEKDVLRLEHSNETRLLAAGVSHNINNALQAITSQASIIQALSSDPQISEACTSIQNSIVQASQTTKRLTRLDRIDESTLSIIDLNSALLMALNNQKSLIKSHNSTQKKIILSFGTPPQIFASYKEIVFALEQIIQNANEATPRGEISLTTDEIFLKDYQIETLPAGHYGVVKIKDTGCGMNEEKRTHCTLPFFTTKNLEKHSGLGLSGEGLGLTQAYSIIQNLKGTIQIESIENVGTTVTVYLPKA